MMVTKLTHKKETGDVIKLLDELNTLLKGQQMLPLMIVSPDDCVGAEVNARYMPPQTMQILIENISRDGRLSSVPLVWKDETLPEGKYRIISGHHRIEAAKAAKVPKILVMVDLASSQDEIISKQLSHNSLVGLDNKDLLLQLFESIKDTTLKFASGISSEIDPIKYSAISFKVGSFKEISLLFIPDQIEDLDQSISELAIKTSATIYIEEDSYFDKVATAIRRIKRIENIKNTSSAVSRLIELGYQKMLENEMDR